MIHILKKSIVGLVIAGICLFPAQTLLGVRQQQIQQSTISSKFFADKMIHLAARAKQADKASIKKIIDELQACKTIDELRPLIGTIVNDTNGNTTELKAVCVVATARLGQLTQQMFFSLLDQMSKNLDYWHKQTVKNNMIKLQLLYDRYLLYVGQLAVQMDKLNESGSPEQTESWTKELLILINKQMGRSAIDDAVVNLLPIVIKHVQDFEPRTKTEIQTFEQGHFSRNWMTYAGLAAGGLALYGCKHYFKNIMSSVQDYTMTPKQVDAFKARAERFYIQCKGDNPDRKNDRDAFVQGLLDGDENVEKRLHVMRDKAYEALRITTDQGQKKILQELDILQQDLAHAADVVRGNGQNAYQSQGWRSYIPGITTMHWLKDIKDEHIKTLHSLSDRVGNMREVARHVPIPALALMDGYKLTIDIMQIKANKMLHRGSHMLDMAKIAIPTLAITVGALYFAVPKIWSYFSSTGSYAEIKTALSEIERALNAYDKSSSTVKLEQKDYGKVVYQLHILDGHVTRVPSDKQRSFIADLHALANTHYSVQQKKSTIKRMYRTYDFLGISKY